MHPHLGLERLLLPPLRPAGHFLHRGYAESSLMSDLTSIVLSRICQITRRSPSTTGSPGSSVGPRSGTRNAPPGVPRPGRVAPVLLRLAPPLPAASPRHLIHRNWKPTSHGALCRYCEPPPRPPSLQQSSPLPLRPLEPPPRCTSSPAAAAPRQSRRCHFFQNRQRPSAACGRRREPPPRVQFCL